MRIHFLSNSLQVNSGFSKVTQNLALGLMKLNHFVSMTGLQTSGIVQYYYGIECHPIDSGGHIDDAGQLFLNLQKIQPDVMIFVGQMDYDMNHLPKVFKKVVCYPPVEGRDIGRMMTNDLKYIINNGGKVVSQCFYGQSEMKKAGIENTCIYHGYDPDIFKNIENMDRMEPYCYYRTEIGKINTNPVELHKMGCYDCRHTIFSSMKCSNYKEEIVSFLKWDSIDNSTDKRWVQIDIGISKLKDELKGREKRFIYLFVGQNNGLRKRIERLLKSYAILIGENKRLKDRTHLHLHTLPISIMGANLIKIIGDLGINDNVTFSYGAFRSSGWSEPGLNILYNLADCQVTATSSEGFMLPVVEGYACGLPIVAPDCTSLTELIGNDKDESKNRGLLVEIESRYMTPDGSERTLVNCEDLALKMKNIYNDDKLREKLGKNAKEWVKQYTWDEICKSWDSLLKGMK